MTVCAACGHPNRDDLHFCESCGEYLRWDQPSEVRRPDPEPEPGSPTLVIPPGAPAEPAPAPTPVPAPAPVAAREPVQVVLEGATHDGTPLRLPVEAGGSVRLAGLVRNQSGIVDAFDIALDGLPAGWWRAEPPALNLLPLGATGGPCEGAVAIVIEPPRTPEARAGAWPVRATATSRSAPTSAGTAAAQVEIAPYEAIEADVSPERVIGAGRADYRLTVANRGNAPAAVRLHGEDADGEVEFRFEPPQLALEPGQEAVVAVRATAPRPSGEERDRRLTIHADAGSASAALPAAFVQPPRVRRMTALWWRVLLTLASAALLIAGSFPDWVDGLDGICRDGASGCLSYDVYVDRAVDVQVDRPDAPDRLAGLVDAVTSMGIVTLLLGALVLLGARTARLVWIAGAAAIIYMVAVLGTLGDAGEVGAWMALLGGVLAIAASLVAGIRRPA